MAASRVIGELLLLGKSFLDMYYKMDLGEAQVVLLLKSGENTLRE